MSEINLPLVLALILSVAGILYFSIFWNKGYAYVNEMYNPLKPQSSKGKFKQAWEGSLHWLSQNIGQKAIEELDKVGISRKSFAKQLIFAPLGGFIYGVLNSKFLFRVTYAKSLLVGTVFAVICLVITRVVVSKKVKDHRMKRIHAVPDLVNQLKISLIAGETVENSLWNAISFVNGPLQKSLIDMKRQAEGGKEFGVVLSEEVAKTDEMEVIKVWHRLQSYHNAGIVQRENVFHDMAENLAHIQADKALMMVERTHTPLTLLMFLGLVGLIIRIGIPVLIVTMQKVTN